MTNYFLPSPKIWCPVCPDAVEDFNASNPEPFKVEGKHHPCIVLLPRPTLRAMEAIQSSDGDSIEQGRVIASVMIQRLKGDWSLYAGGGIKGTSQWRQLDAEAKSEIVRSLLDRDMEAIAKAMEVSTTLSKEDKGKSEKPSS